MNLVTLKDFVIFTESQGAGVSVLDFVFLYKVVRCGCVIFCLHTAVRVSPLGLGLFVILIGAGVSR